MSGGAHHNPHGRQGQPNSAWNHLQVPNFFPRQPQLAHMSSDRPLSLSPLTWHTPTTTEPPTKNTPGPLYNLQQMMLAEPRNVQSNPLDNIALAARDRLEGLGISLNRQTSLEAIQSFTRHVALPGPGLGSVDLTLARSAPSPHSLSCSPSMMRNGQNGEASGPISLSVRDTKQINSMDTAELNKLQTGRSLEIINTSPGISQRSNSPKSPKPFKRATKKMDSILERLNSAPADLCSTSRQSPGILVQPSCEDHSSQSHESRLPSPVSSLSVFPLGPPSDLHLPSTLATEDSTESIDKLRHKRKPDKTTRIEKEDKEISDRVVAPDIISISNPASITLKKVEVPSEKLQSIVLAQAPDSTKATNEVQNTEHIKESPNEKIIEKSDSVIEPNSVIIQDSKLNAVNLINSSETINQGNMISLLKEPIGKQVDLVENQEPALTPNSSMPVADLSSSLSTKNPTEFESPIPAKDNLPSVNKLNASVVKAPALSNNTTAPIIKRRSSNEESHVIPCKVRRKTCSESETIDNIAAMIASGDDVPVVVPKNMNNETIGIKDSQSLAHVLAGPVIEEDINLASTNTEKISNSKIDENPNGICPISENKEDNMIPQTTPDAPEQDNNHTTDFVEVENELEKMFAGIDEMPTEEIGKTSEITQTRDNVTSTSNENKPKRKLSNTAGRASRKSSESAENTPKKKNPEGNKKTPNKSKGRKIKGGKNQTQKNAKFKAKFQDPAVKDILTYDSGSNASSNKSRGPFVQIKGPRDSPISVSIVNTSTNDEDPENRMKHTKTKKHHDDAEFRHKMRKGLHSSTLSMKYDATTTDVTWVCVFCKNGPHCGGTNLGDLFGPYLVTTGCPEFQYSQQNPEDDPFKSKRTKQDMIARNMLNPNNKQIKRKRSSHSESQMADVDIYAGMVEASPGAYEVWGHEECIIWAPGVYLVGSRVIGLEGAVWSSCRAKCSLCNLTGANVGCSQRGCDKFAHISCAARNDWSILEEVYKATCPNHHST